MVEPFKFFHDWYFDHGVPGNLAASAITGTLAVMLGYFKIWKKHIVPHIKRTEQIHRHLNPHDSYQIGKDEANG